MLNFERLLNPLGYQGRHEEGQGIPSQPQGGVPNNQSPTVGLGDKFVDRFAQSFKDRNKRISQGITEPIGNLQGRLNTLFKTDPVPNFDGVDSPLLEQVNKTIKNPFVEGLTSLLSGKDVNGDPNGLGRVKQDEQALIASEKVKVEEVVGKIEGRTLTVKRQAESLTTAPTGGVGTLTNKVADVLDATPFNAGISINPFISRGSLESQVTFPLQDRGSEDSPTQIKETSDKLQEKMSSPLLREGTLRTSPNKPLKPSNDLIQRYNPYIGDNNNATR